MKKLMLALCLSLFAAGMLLGCPPAEVGNNGTTENNEAGDETNEAGDEAGDETNEAGDETNEDADNGDGE